MTPTVCAEQEAKGAWTVSHLRRVHNQRRGGVQQRRVGWRARLVLKDEGTFAPQPVRSFKDFAMQLLLPQHTRAQRLLRHRKPRRRSKLPDSRRKQKVDSFLRGLFIYVRLMLCARQQQCRNYRARLCGERYARGGMRSQRDRFPAACVSVRRCQFEGKCKFGIKVYKN